MWRWAIIIVSLATAPGVAAAPPTLDIDPSRKSCEVGDPIEVSVTATFERGVHLAEPVLHRRLRDVVQTEDAVLESPEPAGDGLSRQSWRSTFVPFLTGEVPLPEIAVGWTSSDGATGEVRVSLGTLTVNSVLHMGITPTEPEPARGPFTMPVPRPRWPYYAAAIAVAVLVALWWLVRWWRRRGEPLPTHPRRVRPPHEIALEELAALTASDLTREGDFRVFFYTMTDIVRVYFEREFGIGAPEMTSTELLEALRADDFPAGLCEQVERWIRASDLVKYARQRPRPQHCEQAVKMAKAIVVAAHQCHLARGAGPVAEAA